MFGGGAGNWTDRRMNITEWQNIRSFENQRWSANFTHVCAQMRTHTHTHTRTHTHAHTRSHTHTHTHTQSKKTLTFPHLTFSTHHITKETSPRTKHQILSQALSEPREHKYCSLRITTTRHPMQLNQLPCCWPNVSFVISVGSNAPVSETTHAVVRFCYANVVLMLRTAVCTHYVLCGTSYTLLILPACFPSQSFLFLAFFWKVIETFSIGVFHDSLMSYRPFGFFCRHKIDQNWILQKRKGKTKKKQKKKKKKKKRKSDTKCISGDQKVQFLARELFKF